MKIGRLASESGLAPSAIRYYEKIGLLPPADRLRGQRRYSSDALDRLLLIRLASEMDFSLAEIKLFLNGFRPNTPVSARWRRLAARKIPQLRQRLLFTRRLLRFLQRLQGCCTCIQLHQCVSGLRLSTQLRDLRLSRPSATSRRPASPSKQRLY